MWLIDSKQGILTGCRIASTEIIEDSFQSIESLLENDTLEDWDFYESFVPFLKNFISLVSFFDIKDERIKRAQFVLENIKTKQLSWLDVSEINYILGEIKAYISSNSSDETRRKNSLVNSIQKYLSSLKGKTGVSNKIHSFMNDYNRIVYSPSFRRLQDKAQVYPLEQHDYVRTRLTHSIEVSSIAAQLGNITAIKLFSKDNTKKKNVAFQTEKILSCAALLHDIGNPPFGHFGEDAIKTFFEKNFDTLKIIDYSQIKNSKNLPKNLPQKKLIKLKTDASVYEQLKRDFTMFDGNAQSFRIATKTEMYKPDHSLELTAAVLGAIIKYPFPSNFNKRKWGKPKFGYFYSENAEFELLTKMKVAELNVRNPLVLLLEAADDICYVTSDLDDAVKKNILTYEMFVKEIQNEKDVKDESVRSFINRFEDYYKKNSDYDDVSAFSLTMQRMLNDLRIRLIGETSEAFIKNYNRILNGIKVVKTDNNCDGLYTLSGDHCYDLLGCIKSKALVKWLRDLFPEHIYFEREIVENELKGFEIITYLLAELVDSVLKLEFDDNGKVTKRSKNRFPKQYHLFQLISPNFVRTFKKEIKKDGSNELTHIYYRLKLVVDYISGMTDSYAKEVYEKLRGVK